MRMLVVEMLVLSAFVVGLLYMALHPTPKDREKKNNESPVEPVGEEH